MRLSADCSPAILVFQIPNAGTRADLAHSQRQMGGIGKSGNQAIKSVIHQTAALDNTPRTQASGGLSALAGLLVIYCRHENRH